MTKSRVFFEEKNMMKYDIEITSHHTVYFKHLGPYKQREKQTDRHIYIKYIKPGIERKQIADSRQKDMQKLTQINTE